MMHESDTALIGRLSAVLTGAQNRAEVIAVLGDYLKAVCDRHALPTDGLGQKQSSLIWQRQIALLIAANSCGVEGPRREILETMAEAERTVWEDDALDDLADQLTDQAHELAEEWRGEAQVLRGEI